MRLQVFCLFLIHQHAVSGNDDPRNGLALTPDAHWMLDQDLFEKSPLPELLTRIKIDLKRLFVTVIDHTAGSEHQLLFLKKRFLAKDHPDRAKIERFSAKLRSVTKMVAV